MSRTKIKNIPQLKKIISRLKKQGRKIIFTNGCFDILHAGHVEYLQKAKAKGDILVVAVNSDASVKRIKGNQRPIVRQGDRCKILAGLENVDYVTIFNQDTPLETIQALKPDALIKGADWKINKIIGADFLNGYGGKVETVKLTAGRSTTKIINEIIKKYA